MRLAKRVAEQVDEAGPILAVEGLSVALPKGADRPFAVENVSLELRRGEILCIVGESGSGKSALSGAIMGAPAPGLRVAGGSVRLKGQELTKLSERAWCRIRGNRIAMIFQEPMASLNPAVPVGQQIMEVFELHAQFSVAERRERALALIRSMQLPDPERIAASYPHQLSGGQCQRVIIAMALAMSPEVLIADEPTTALDVTTQAQVLKLIRELRTLHGHTILFITHDFGVVAEIADRIAVMRHGRIIEMGDAQQVLTQPQHPYTQELLAAVPSLVPPTAEQGGAGGVVPEAAGTSGVGDRPGASVRMGIARNACEEAGACRHRARQELRAGTRGQRDFVRARTGYDAFRSRGVRVWQELAGANAGAAVRAYLGSR